MSVKMARAFRIGFALLPIVCVMIGGGANLVTYGASWRVTLLLALYFVMTMVAAVALVMVWPRRDGNSAPDVASGTLAVVGLQNVPDTPGLVQCQCGWTHECDGRDQAGPAMILHIENDCPLNPLNNPKS